jgi:anti-repressor protein
VEQIVNNSFGMDIIPAVNNQHSFIFGNMDIRIIMIDENPWWIAKDIYDVLELENVTQAINKLDDDEQSMFNIGRQGNVNIINESGLYCLI